MAKRRTLKRDIGYLAGELFTEVLVSKMLIPNIDHDKADALLSRILDLQDEYNRRASTPDGKENPKRIRAYYKKLLTDLQAETDAIGKEIEGLGQGQA